jgi:hypothetical protein
MHKLGRLEKLEMLLIALMMALGLAVHIAQTAL